MAKLIGISGPQGGGKTTLLNGLRGKGFAVDDFKVSRAVQAELGWERLDNVLTDFETMKTFQQKVSDVKHAREQENLERTDVELILTERTFADIAAYTHLWCWELAHDNKVRVSDAIRFLFKFIDECAARQHVYDAVIMLPSMPNVAWQVDANRAKEEHIEYILDQLDYFLKERNPWNVPVFRITAGSVEDRINQVDDWIKTL